MTTLNSANGWTNRMLPFRSATKPKQCPLSTLSCPSVIDPQPTFLPPSQATYAVEMETATQNLKRAVELLAKPPTAQQEALEDCGINAPYYSEELWLQFDLALDWVKRDIGSDPRAAEAVAIVRPIVDFFQEPRRPGFSDRDAIYDHGDWSMLRELAGGVAIELERDDV